MNGVHHPSESIHVFNVGKMRIKLCKAKTTIAKEYYSTSMLVTQIVLSLFSLNILLKIMLLQIFKVVFIVSLGWSSYHLMFGFFLYALCGK